MDYILIIGAAALGLAFSGKKGGSKNSSASGKKFAQKVSQQNTLLNPADSMKEIGLSESDWPEMIFDIPFAAGSPTPIWPTVTNHNRKFAISYRTVSGSIVENGARRFMTDRGSGKYHVGVDLYANPDDPLLAMEDGVILNHYHFYHGSYALFLQCKSGLIINYGEVKKDSWKEFGLSKGSRVKKGQPIARVGLMSGGSHMLHFETYVPPTDRNVKYYGEDDYGPILNPTYYLLRARFFAQSGKVFSGTDCTAIASLNRPVPEEFESIAIDDRLANESPGDSVLTELLVNDQWRPEKDNANGP